MADTTPSPVTLTDEETPWYYQVITLLESIKEMIKKRFPDKGKYNESMDDMALAAHELHLSLKNRDLEPLHHKYMIENRGMDADDEDFYRHVHPTEDLLAFIEDRNANIDPEDVTIGEKFTFTYYTRRWGHDEEFSLTRTRTGWIVHRGLGPPITIIVLSIV